MVYHREGGSRDFFLVVEPNLSSNGTVGHF